MKKFVIIFDVDGTLFDTREGIIQALNYVLKVYGRAPIEKSDESKYIGPPVKKALIEYQGMDEVEAEEAADLYRRCYVEKFIGESAVYDGTLETLVTLKRLGCFLGIATMKTMPQLETLLRNFDCDEFFSVLKAARADGSLTKSQMLKDIRDEHSELNTFVMVGDTVGDFQAAEKAGYRFVAADYGYGDVRSLETRHIGHISELLEYHAYLCKK